LRDFIFKNRNIFVEILGLELFVFLLSFVVSLSEVEDHISSSTKIGDLDCGASTTLSLTNVSSFLHSVCHFEEREISTSSSTKIGDLDYGASTSLSLTNVSSFLRSVCHFEEREISTSSSTKIGNLDCGTATSLSLTNVSCFFTYSLSIGLVCHFDRREKSPQVARQRLEIKFVEFLAKISPYVEMTKMR